MSAAKFNVQFRFCNRIYDLVPVDFTNHRLPLKKAALILGICFVLVGILVPLSATLVTFMLPEVFASSTKMLYATNNPAPLDMAVARIMSRSSLDQVATNLNLTVEWARKYKQPGELSLAQCSAMLNKMISINLPRGAPLMEISIHSDNREEAAAIANEITAVYLKTSPGASLIQSATPGVQPVRPNKRLNITLGIFAGVTLLIVGIGLLIASRIARNQK